MEVIEEKRKMDNVGIQKVNQNVLSTVLDYMAVQGFYPGIWFIIVPIYC